MKVLLARHRLFCSLELSFFFGGGGGCNINRIIHDGARAERIDSFFGGKNLGLVSINKLRQLCKSIFDIEI